MGLNEKLFTGGAAGPFVPSDNFNTVLYTGNNGTQNITTVGFQPDFVWFKNRIGTNAHAVVNSVRTRAKYLFPNLDDQEATSATGRDLATFDANGFTLGQTSQAGSTNINSGSTDNIVAWCWKAGGAAVSNTDGSKTSQVSANVDAGFSIVETTFDSNQSGLTVGHGLDEAPTLIIVKRTDADEDWYVKYNVVDGSSDQMRLNTSATSEAANFTPTSTTVIGFGSTGAAHTTIAYAFHSVDGFSKIGFYNGNNGSNPITTGFRPAFLMIKRSNTSGSWLILDNKRETSNPRHTYLFPASGSTESVVASNLGYDVDFDNNGFELKGSGGDVNASGSKYIFMAFAE